MPDFTHSVLSVNDADRSLRLSLISDSLVESRVDTDIDRVTVQSDFSIADIKDFISLLTGIKS